jgi:hypothetical protein
MNATKNLYSGCGGGTEDVFIANEQAKLDAKMLRTLRKVRRTGFASKHTIEMLLVNRLAVLSPPRDHIAYNHYRLTDCGMAMLERLESK